MAGFTRTLSQPQGMSTLVAPVETPSAEASKLGQVNDALKAGFEVQDNITQSNVREDLIEVDRQESIFTDEAATLQNILLSPTDKRQLNDVNDQLTRLERGRAAGKLTPAEAEIRRNAILKSAVNSNPWIASELKATASIYGGGGRGKIQKTPEQEALDAQREVAAKLRQPLSLIVEYDNLIIRNEALAAKASIAADQGKLKFSGYREVVNAISTEAVGKIHGAMMAMFANDPNSIDGVDWENQIRIAKDKTKSSVMAMEAKFARNNAIFGKTERDTITSDIDHSFALAEQFALSTDKLKVFERNRKMIGEIGFETLMENNELYATLLQMGEPQAFQFAYVDFPAVQATVTKHGGLNRLKEAAARGDTDATKALVMWELRPSLMARFIKEKLLTGDRPQSEFDKLATKMMAGKVMDGHREGPMTPSDKGMFENANKIMLDPADSTYENLQYYLKPNTFNNMSANPVALKRLMNESTARRAKTITLLNQEVSRVAHKGAQLKSELQFNSQENKFEVKILAGVPGASEIIVPNTLSSLIDNLNFVWAIDVKYEHFNNRKRFIDSIVGQINKVGPPPEEATLDPEDVELGGLDDE